MSWEERWREGRTGWDAGESSPALHALVRSGTLPEGRAFVPGCGSGYDVFTLASESRHATGLEVAPTAAERFERLRAERGIDPTRAAIVCEDFFGYAPDEKFDMVWDYTFLCALPPERRTDWAAKMDALLAPDGELVTLIFPVGDWNGPKDPPWRMTPELVHDLLAPTFVRHHLEAVSESHSGRQGHEWLARWRRARPATAP